MSKVKWVRWNESFSRETSTLETSVKWNELKVKWVKWNDSLKWNESLYCLQMSHFM